MKRLFESDRAWWMMITYCYGMLWAHNPAIIILYNMIHMISYNYQWKCWLETSCFTGVQPDARVPNFGSRVLINLREPWHQEGLERLTERMDCNEQARKDSFASHKQLNGSLKWVQDSRYFIIFTSNTTRIAQILCCMMLCWHLKLLWREVSVSAEHLELFHHKIAIDAPSEALRIDAFNEMAHARQVCGHWWSATWNFHLHLQNNSMLHHVVTPCFQERKRERESWSMLQLARLGCT